MKPKILYFPLTADALENAIKSLEGRTVDLSSRVFIIVPDRVTLTAERLVCKILGGAMDVEVTTFSRLARSVTAKEKTFLTKQGSIMLIKKIIEENSGSLKCFRRSASTKGFARRLFDTITLLQDSLVSPEDLKLKNGKEKAEDIAFIYRKYLDALGEYAPDASGRMKLLRERILSTDALTRTRVIIACFDYFSEQEKSVISAMRSRAASFSMFLPRPVKLKLNNVHVYESDSEITSAKSIAAKIAYLIKTGTSPDDIAVLTSETNPSEIKRLFTENGIPFSASDSLSLSRHPLGSFINMALDAPLKGYRARDVIKLAKSPYSGCDEKYVMDFERYVLKYGVSYKGFFSKFDKPDEKFYDGAERVRRKMSDILERYFSDIPKRLELLLETASVSAPEIVDEENLGRANAFARLKEIQELVSRLLSKTSPRIAVDAISDALSAAELGRRPTYRNAVEIGRECDLIARRFKYIFVPDFIGDNHPGTVSDSGLLSDDDVGEIRSRIGECASTSIEINKRKKDELYGILAAASDVCLYYTSSSGRLLGEIKGMASLVTEKSVAEEIAVNFAGGGKGLMKNCPTPNMLVEQTLIDEGRILTYGTEREPSYFKYAEEYSKEARDSMFRYLAAGEEIVEEAGELMSGKTISPARLENYFICPKKYFFSSALQAKKPDEAQLSSINIGNIIHYVAEHFITVMDALTPEEAAKRFIKEALEKEEKEATKLELQMLEEEAVDLLKEIVRQRDVGAFRPVAAELSFGLEGSELKAIELGEENGTTLVGVIDRVDSCGPDKYVRVFDYKTGKVDISKELLATGRKIQLPLYLLALREAGYKPAGAFYMPTQRSRNGYGIKGIVDASEEVTELMNGSGVLYDLPRKKDGTLKDNKSLDVIGYEDGLDEILDDTKELAEKAADEISAGFIAASPYSKRNCEYCDYKTCCGYEGPARDEINDSEFDEE